MTPIDHYRRREAPVSISPSARVLNADCLAALRRDGVRADGEPRFVKEEEK